MKFVVYIFMILSFSFAADFSMPAYVSKIDNSDSKFAFIKDSPSIIKGSSGIIIHTFDNGLSSIIARAVVIEKDGVRAKVRFEVFKNLSQDALPVTGILPKDGDFAILNYLYDRAIIVAPNEAVFNDVKNAFKNITFIHPDIVASYLSAKRIPKPAREDFRKACADNSAGLIFFALDDRGIFADCGSFEVIKEFKTQKAKYYQLPFYSNIKSIKKSIFDFTGSSKISNYNMYYSKMLKD